jgi:uncharacterized RDD family membrane protein YckC
MAAQPPASGGWETPADATQGPAPGVRFASPGARLGAYLIDLVIQVLVAIVVFVVAGLLGAVAGGSDSGLLQGTAIIVALLAVLVYFLWTVAYFPYFWSRGGQTPGMRVTHVKVVRDVDGGPVTFGPAFLRLVGYWINNLLFYIGFIWILVDKRRRGWHDLIAGTCVIEA